MRCARFAATATAVLGLAACSQGSPSMSERMSNMTQTSSVTQDMNSTSNLSDFERSAGQKPVPVIVEGNAFGLNDASLEQQVANSMKSSYWGPRANFVPAAQARTMPQEPDYLVVMRLTPASGTQNVTGAQLCADQYRMSSAGTNTNATVAANPPRGAANPARKNNSASTTSRTAAAANDEARYRNYNLTPPSNRSAAAAAVGRQEQINEADASTSVQRGSTNPASRNDSASVENRPAAIGPEDRLHKPEAGNMTSSAGVSPGYAMGGTPSRTTTSNRAGATASTRSDVHVVSALCHYNTAVRSVDTHAWNVSGPSDPVFNNMIVTTTNQLTQPLPVPEETPAEPGQER
jgi:hypothetical protein